MEKSSAFFFSFSRRPSFLFSIRSVELHASIIQRVVTILFGRFATYLYTQFDHFCELRHRGRKCRKSKAKGLSRGDLIARRGKVRIEILYSRSFW